MGRQIGDEPWLGTERGQAVLTKAYKWIALASVVAFLFAMANAPSSLPESIQRECEREYGNQGAAAVNRCFIAIAATKLQANEAAKIKRTHDRVVY